MDGGIDGSSNWSDPGNWADGVPQSGDALVFPADAARTDTVNDLSGLELESVSLSASYVLRGNEIRLRQGIIDASWGGSAFARLETPIVLEADQRWTAYVQVDGVIRGSANLTLGSLGRSTIFTADNTYSGTTTVLPHSGLTVTGNQPFSPIILEGERSSLTSEGPLPQNDLDGTVGPVTAKAGSYVNPGRFLDVAGNLALEEGSTYWAEQLGADPEGLRVQGEIKLQNATLHLNVVPRAPSVFTIIDNDGTDAVTGTFAALPEGATIRAQDQSLFRISYRGGDGNDVVLTRTDAESPGSTTTTTTTTPTTSPPPGRTRYVALGDSYSSGEGNPPYLPGTDTSRNKCHRSLNSYVYRLVPRSVRLVHVACSGALIYDMNNHNFAGNIAEGPQLDALDSRTTLVTLTVGGNDMGFGYVLGECAGLGDCSRDPKLANLLAKHLSWLYTGHARDCSDEMFLRGGACAPPSPSLSQLYKQIASRAPHAKIVVLNYPSLFARTPSGNCAVERLLWSRNEQMWINAWGQRLNQAIALQVVAARAAGVNIELADVWTAFGDHGVCTADPWIRGLVGAFQNEIFFSSVSFHPNAAGQLAMLKAARRAL